MSDNDTTRKMEVKFDYIERSFTINTDFSLEQRNIVVEIRGGLRKALWGEENRGVEVITPRRYSVKVEVGEFFEMEPIAEAYFDALEKWFLEEFEQSVATSSRREYETKPTG